MQLIDWSRFCSLISRALDEGATVKSSLTVYWDCAPRCDNPYLVRLYSKRPDKNHRYHAEIPVERSNLNGSPRFLDIETKCRKCHNCLDDRAKEWRSRAFWELQRSPRTWFATYTIAPDYRVVFACRAKSDDFKPIYNEISKEFTKYIKRLRKAGFKFRYVLVAEAHKDGFPHLHALIHENSVLSPIPKRELAARWPFGYTTFKLADKKSAFYICKYLSKAVLARVRASQRYGQPPE